MKRFKTLRLILVFVVCAGLLLSACGNQDADTPTTAHKEMEPTEDGTEIESEKRKYSGDGDGGFCRRGFSCYGRL